MNPRLRYLYKKLKKQQLGKQTNFHEPDEHNDCLTSLRHSKAICLKIKQKLKVGPERLNFWVSALNIDSVSGKTKTRFPPMFSNRKRVNLTLSRLPWKITLPRSTFNTYQFHRANNILVIQIDTLLQSPTSSQSFHTIGFLQSWDNTEQNDLNSGFKSCQASFFVWKNKNKQNKIPTPNGRHPP